MPPNFLVLHDEQVGEVFCEQLRVITGYLKKEQIKETFPEDDEGESQVFDF